MPRNSTHTKLSTLRGHLARINNVQHRNKHITNARKYIVNLQRNANFKRNIQSHNNIVRFLNQAHRELHTKIVPRININRLNKLIQSYEAISNKPNINMNSSPRRNNGTQARRNLLAGAAERRARGNPSAAASAERRRNAATRLVRTFRNFSERMKDGVFYNNLQPRFYRIEWKTDSTMHYRYYNPKTMAGLMGLGLPQNSTHNAAEQAVNAQLQHMGPHQRVMNNPETRLQVQRRQVSKRTRRGRINGAPPAPPAAPAGHPYPHLWALHQQPPPQVPPPPTASMLFGHHY